MSDCAGTRFRREKIAKTVSARIGLNGWAAIKGSGSGRVTTTTIAAPTSPRHPQPWGRRCAEIAES